MFHLGGVFFLTAVINATLDVKPRARILAMMTVSDSCCNQVIALSYNTEGIDSQLEEKFRDVAKECRDSAHAVLQSGNDEAAGPSDALLDGGEGKRRSLRKWLGRWKQRMVGNPQVVHGVNKFSD